MSAWYNEIEPYAAAWLRNLIAAGEIAPGVVDERDIRDVRPDEIAGFTQCHFFAGIGVWSHALRRAGWPDDRPVWTGSCPCQPFSAAGRGDGAADERHLWPHWHYLISQRRPAVVFGEQVEAAIRHGWLDLVQADMEGIGYTCGAVAAPAAGFGAPHIRARLYFVAHTDDEGLGGWGVLPERTDKLIAGAGGVAGVMAIADNAIGRADAAGGHERQRPDAGRPQSAGDIEGRGRSGELADAAGGGCGEQRDAPQPGRSGHVDSSVAVNRRGPVNGFWRDADWIACTDAKWRPVEPGTFPLAHGASARVGRLRAYGNAICATQAQAFIESCMRGEP